MRRIDNHTKLSMPNQKNRAIIERLLLAADIRIDGDRPWDIHVHNKGLFDRVIQQGSMGLGESYMDGWWDAEKLDEFFAHLLVARLDKQILGDWRTIVHILGQIVLNPQRKSKSFEVGERHYDIGNDLYDAMLDPRKVYTCAYWNEATTLDSAQEAKLDLVCRKIGLKQGQHILDIGCGWGSFAKFAAEKYGAHVTGITNSKEQFSLGNELCKGLPVEFIFSDYRDIEGEYDHIVSLGMFEHVGYKNYRTFMEVAAKHLKDDGLFLLHTIGTNESTTSTDPWITKYIFPNGMLPSIKYIGASIEKLFIMQDWHCFGTDYDKTLLAWYENFDRNWETLKPAYGDRFYRMWKYYLLASAATFRIQDNNLWQIVLSKKGIRSGYTGVR